MSALTGKMPRAEMNQELLLGLAALLAVNCALEHGARNKLRNVGLRNRDRFACSGITASASRANLLLKGAEANERQRIIILDGVDDFFGDRRQNAGSFRLGQTMLFRNLCNEFETIHILISPCTRWEYRQQKRRRQPAALVGRSKSGASDGKEHHDRNCIFSAPSTNQARSYRAGPGFESFSGQRRCKFLT